MSFKKILRLRTYFPSGLAARFVLLSIVPLVLLLMVSGYAFYKAHKTDSMAKAALFAGNIATLVDIYKEVDDAKEYGDFRRLARDNFAIDAEFAQDARLAKKRIKHRIDLLSARFIEKSLSKRLALPFALEADEASSLLGVDIQYPKGVLSMRLSLKSVFSRSIYGFALWILGAGAAFLILALPLLRGQVESIKRLTAAIDRADRGEDISDVKFTGARQIVEAGRDMMRAYARIKSHIDEQKEMLQSISHDLKTPLTRMTLELEFADDKSLQLALSEDIEEMKKMIDSYLDFARGGRRERVEPADLSALLSDSIRRANRGGYDIALSAPRKFVAKVQPGALSRALANVLGNAIRYGGEPRKIAVSLAKSGRWAEIIVEDNGPGIAEERRAEMLRPFARLDDSRGKSTGGVGLGLAIVAEIMRSHGGEIELGESASLGGLRAVLRIPA